MKLIKKSITAALICTCMSCADLDINPLSQGSSGNWYSSVEEIEMCIADVYRSAFFPIMDAFNEDDMVNRANSYGFVNGSLTAENGSIKNYWSNYYYGIGRLLKLIEGLDKNGESIGLSAAKINEYKAHAYAYLGFAYGNLAFHWGDVVLCKSVMALEEAYTATRTNKDEVLQYAYECFDKAIESLPTSYSGIQYMTKGAALGFKARIALLNGDYDIVESAAKACMDLGIYKLHDNYEKLFTEKKWSDEWLFIFHGDETFGINYWIWGYPRALITRTNGGNATGQYAVSYELVCAYTCTDGLPIDESPLYDPEDLWANRDPRMAMTTIPWASYKKRNSGTYDPNDYIWLGNEYSIDPTVVTVYNPAKDAYVSNGDSKGRGEHAIYNGFHLKKYVDDSWMNNASYTAAYNTVFPYLRYADVLLMYAEAMIEQNKCTQEVLDATINKVRERAYNGTGIAYPRVMVDSQAKLRTILRTERFVELACENRRYDDLIRWRIAEKVFNTPTYYNPRTWSGNKNWDGQDLGSTPAAFQKLVDDWKHGNYPIGGVPEIDENGLADLSYMEAQGWITPAAGRKFNKDRDYLWPIPASEILVNPNLTQNPGW